MNAFEKIYKGKNVLITGHTGFKGSWMSIWLNSLGANVIGYALDPYTEYDNFVVSNLKDKIIDIRGDIRDKNKLNEVFKKYKPEFVFHMAAQPIVSISYELPVDTYEINVMGTINVLEAIRNTAETKVGIIITTDKCYQNVEQVWGYRENDSLGGYDPYSSSKGAAEIAINSWRSSFMNPNNYESHGKSIASVRAGNVIGGGDWSKNRLIPDCIRALENEEIIEIRNPNAIRPWEHVLEPLSGYLLLGLKIYNNPSLYCEAWNFGPNINSAIPVIDICNKIVDKYGRGNIKCIENREKIYESNILTLDISKAIFKLGWHPTLNIDEALSLTVDWYRRYRNENTYDLCLEQIKYFCDSLKGK